MTPLEITAELAGPIALPSGALAIDSLLQAAVVRRDGIPIALTAEECVPISIPVAVEPGGRFHLASFSELVVEARERRFINRRFPIAEAQAMGDAKLRRVDISTGPCKSYRIPFETQHLEGDRVRWWVIGEADPLRVLLGWISYVGKKRSVGLGNVRRWMVEPCTPWGAGFPIVRDGRPLRPLPIDWPGLAPDVERSFRVVGSVAGPYWDKTRETECAVPR